MAEMSVRRDGGDEHQLWLLSSYECEVRIRGYGFYIHIKDGAST